MPDAQQNSVQAFEVLLEQPRVKAHLSAAVLEHKISHAYLFIGAPGSGKLDAALALAQCIICENGGDASCDECIRVAHKTHPDVHWLAPASATGYLVEQIRDLIDDVALSPMRASSKVYILDRVDLLRGSAANALLKTLEEPPLGVVFILCGRSVNAVMPTIVSRCQVVAFRVISELAGLEALERRVACTKEDARIALAVCGSPSRGADFLRSSKRRATRDLVVRSLSELEHNDGWDIVLAARAIVSSVSDQLKDLEVSYELAREEQADFLSPQAMKRLEEANKRALSAQQRAGLLEVLATANSYLRDILILAERVGERIVNSDMSSSLEQLASKLTSNHIVRALGAVAQAQEDLAHNVTPQLAIEVMLFSIKEACFA